ncbi:MAG: PAS domain S-box protein [Deltaproteobacteria bacterium]|nr:PAS domain S-box protein [Deltaproteobacteria bacterium]
MISLDIRTVMFSYALTDIVCVLVIILLWLQNRNRFAGMVLWVYNFVLQLLALGLIVLRGSLPDWISIVLANTLLMTGALLGYMALLRFFGQKTTQIHNYVILALTVFAHAFFTFVKPDLAARELNTSVGLLAICLQCSWLLLYRVGPAARPLTRWVGVVFGAYCLVSVIRIAGYFTGPRVRTDFFEPNKFDAFIMIAYQILFIFLTYALVLMVNKRLHMEITTQEEKYSKAFHSSPYAVMLTRLADGQIIEANEGFFKMAGYEEAEVRGETTMSLHLWPKEEDRAAIIRDLTQTGSLHERELQFRKKSGEMITVLFSAELITVNNERCILVSINDISDRKKMERDLRKSETMIRTTLDNLPIGIAVNSVDPEVNFAYMNENFPKFYRTTREALATPDGFWEAVYEDPQTRNEFRRQVLDDCASGNPECMNWTSIPIRRRGQETTFINAHNIPIPGESLMISVVWDVTDQVTAQAQREEALREIRSLNEALEQKVALRTRELRESQLALLNVVDDLNEGANRQLQTNQALETVNKELAAFSYSVSHDLRAPLRSIDGFSSALMEDYGDKLSDEGKNYLQRIRRATQHMGQLIDDMLNLSRVAQSEFHRQDFDLSVMVREIADAGRQKNPHGNLVFDIQEGVVVHADQRLMNIALTNLIDNAYKFAGKNEHPRIQFGTELQNGETVIFVRDNGVGFDMAYVGRLFGAFQRLHRIDEFPGTGIGLATVQRIIHRHGGWIRAQGELGKGATFYFTLNQ